jgi:phage-related minor tail protein
LSDSGTNIGYAMLPVALSFEDITGNIARSLGIPLRNAGQRAGQDAGQAIAAGVEQAQGKVDAATTKVAAALKKVEDQTGKVRVAEAQYQALLDKGVTDAGRLAAAQEKVAAAQRNLTQAQNAHTNATGALTHAQEELTRAQEKGEQTGRRFTGALGDMGRSVGGALGNLKNLAIATAGIGSAMEIATSAMDMQSATAKMNASLGAIDDMAEQYGKSAASLYGRGFGESMGDVTKAVESVASTFPAISAEGAGAFDKAAERALNLAKVFDIDVAEATQTASQLITNGLAKDSTDAMDKVTAAFQRVPAAMRDELPEVLNEYGKHFQTFGMSGEAAMGLIVDMAPQGKIALDKTGDAIKELSIRATDGSKTTTTAFAMIGADGEKMANAITGGGPAAQEAMQQIATGLLGIADPAVRAQQAIALFGTPLEDLGVDKIPQFLTALSGASGSMNDTAGAADRLGNTVNDTAEHKLSVFGRAVKTGLIEGLGEAVGFLDTVWNSDGVQQYVTTVSGLFQQWWPKIVDVATPVLGVLLDIAKVAGPILVSALGTIVGAIGGVVTAGVGIVNFFRENKELALGLGVVLAATVGPALVSAAAGFTVATAKTVAFGIAQNAVSIATKAWAAAQWLLNVALTANPIGLIVAAIAAFVAGIIYAYKHSETFRKIVDAAWKAIKEAAKAVVDWFVDTAWPWLQKAWEAIGAGWTWLVDTAGEMWDGIKEKFTAMVDFVKGLPRTIADGARGLWDGLKGGLVAVLNWIGDKWNAFADKLSFHIPNPFGDDIDIKIPKLPHFGEFAVGGYTGNLPVKQIAGVVHGDEHVIRSPSRQRIERDHPGLLDHMNATGRVPGYELGGRVGAGYGLKSGTDTGGYGSSGDAFPQWVHDIEAKFGIKASTYAGHQESDRGEAGYAANPNHLNRGIDWTGSVDAMQKFAEWLKSVASTNPQLEQIIWQNPNTGQKIGWGGGADVSGGSYYDYDGGYNAHRNHVHTRFSAPLSTSGQPKPDDATTSVGTQLTSAIGISGSTPNYSGLSDDERSEKYDADNEAAQEAYDKELAALKEQFGLGDNPALEARGRALGKRKRDLAAQYRSDTAAAKGNQVRLDELKEQYQQASDALKDEEDQLADEKAAADDLKAENEPGFEAAKKELDKKYKGLAKERKKAYDAVKDSAKASSGNYPTTLSGWFGFAAEKLVGGQVASLLGVLGIPDNPGWLQGLSSFMGGLKVTDNATGKQLWPFSIDGDTSTASTGDADVTVDTHAGTGSAPGPANDQAAPVAKPAPGADWDAMAQKESGGNWSIPSDNAGQPFRGGLQILDSTWKQFGGEQYAATANLASKDQQIAIAEKILAGQGPGAWPNTFTPYTPPTTPPKKAWWDQPKLYDSGGWLDEGVHQVENRSGGPEPILTQDYWRIAQDGINVAMTMAKGFTGGGGKQLPPVTYNIRTATVEDAFTRAQQQEKIRLASKLDRY